MSDWPDLTGADEQQTPIFINTWHLMLAGTSARNYAALTPAACAWTTANAAIYIPFALPFPYTVRRLFWCNGTTASLNFDIGLYTDGGTRLVSAGSTAQSGTSVPQYPSMANGSLPIQLSPGILYYLAFTASATTSARAYGSASFTAVGGRMAGCKWQTSALPLPATAAFATFAGTCWPLIGFTRTASGF